MNYIKRSQRRFLAYIFSVNSYVTRKLVQKKRKKKKVRYRKCRTRNDDDDVSTTKSNKWAKVIPMPIAIFMSYCLNELSFFNLFESMFSSIQLLNYYESNNFNKVRLIRLYVLLPFHTTKSHFHVSGPQNIHYW